jgi:hypothetical protein
MRRLRRLFVGLVLGGALVAATSLGGCPAAHDDYPGTACKMNSDCYQGEICNGTVCVPNLDMSIVGDFAHPPLDLSMGDLSPGADDMTPVDL